MSFQCILCGASHPLRRLYAAEDWEYGVPGVFVLERCEGCGICYQMPRPTREQLNTFYPPTYAVYDEGSPIAWMHDWVYRQDAKKVLHLIGPKGRVLDVGCGGGGGLEAMRRLGDWELFGLELDPAAADNARRRGFRVQTGELMESTFEPASFDLIRMGHVIEHVLDPLQTLRRARELLRPGGVLLAETPNIECWDFRIFGRYWGALHFPRHVTLLGESSIRALCQRAGLVNVSLEPRARPVGWSASVQNMLIDRFGLPIPPRGRFWWYPLLVAIFLPISLLQSLVSRPATLAFIARRPRD